MNTWGPAFIILTITLYDEENTIVYSLCVYKYIQILLKNFIFLIFAHNNLKHQRSSDHMKSIRWDASIKRIVVVFFLNFFFQLPQYLLIWIINFRKAYFIIREIDGIEINAWLYQPTKKLLFILVRSFRVTHCFGIHNLILMWYLLHMQPSTYKH